MNSLPKYNLPWELISESFTESLSDEQKLQLEQWISANPENAEKYAKLRDIWNNSLEDYRLYQMADEKKAWKSLVSKLNANESNIIRPEFSQSSQWRKIIAIAASFLLLFGIGLWLLVSKSGSITYETTFNSKNFQLKDGSTIEMKPHTKIEVSKDYNQLNRTLTMLSGEASFEVGHRASKPFIIKMGSTEIEDIGTHFNVRKEDNQISVEVASGKVLFVKLATKEKRELVAGTSVIFNLQKESFGDIMPSKSALNSDQMLNFENTSLADVVFSIKKVYGKNIIFDKSIANKKITAHLGGMPYNTVMNVICKSLKLDCSIKDSVYVLKEKGSEQP